MNTPLARTDFTAVAERIEAAITPGLDPQLDAIAERAPETHRFLRRAWYDAAQPVRVRTLVVRQGDAPVLALPFVLVGPALLGIAVVPGSYWPFRSFPLALDASPAALDAALAALARHVRALRIGPVLAGDPAVEALAAAARARGWAVIDRPCGDSWVQDLTDPAWPRASSLKKNRFHEKHLAEHGALDWRFLAGDDWPAAFDLLAAVERASWIADRTDGHDAKFTVQGHGAFWRAAVTDPALRRAMRAALLTVDGRPAAFSFDLDIDAHRYAIANSYDPALAKHSPGKLLQYRNLLDARARGIRTVDWGMGDSGYKQVLGAVKGPAFVDRLLLRPGLPARIGRAIARRYRR